MMEIRSPTPEEAKAFSAVRLSFDHVWPNDKPPWHILDQRAREILAPTSELQGAFVPDEDGERLIALWGRSLGADVGPYLFIDVLPEVTSNLQTKTQVWWAVQKWLREQPCKALLCVGFAENTPAFGRIAWRA